MSTSYSLAAAERQAYEKLPVPFCVLLIRKGRCALLAASEGACAVFGENLRHPAVSCRTLLPLHFYPDDAAQLQTDLEQACLDPNGQYAAAYRIRTVPEAPYRWYSAKGRVARQADGAYLLYVFFTDVHDETALRQEEADRKIRQDSLFSDILSTTKTAIFWKDTNRRFLGANKAFLDYYGFADEREILGKNDEEMGWHTEPDPYKNDELRILRDGTSTYRVPGLCLARGENRNIVASKSPLVVNGKIVGLVGSFEDVTNETRQRGIIQRLNAELEARIADRDLLMSISDTCIAKIRLCDDALIEYNETLCRMLGYTQTEFQQLFHDNVCTYFSGAYQNDLSAVKEAAALAITQKRQKIPLHMRIPTRSGSIYISGTASFTDQDPDTGQPANMYVVYRDVSDIVEAQKRLADAEIKVQKAALLESQMLKMRRMIDGVPAGVGALRITDGKPERLMQLNQYFTERIRVTADAGGCIDLDAFLTAVHPEDQARCNADFQEFLRTRLPAMHTYRMQTREDGYVWIHVRATVTALSPHNEIAYFSYTNVHAMKTAEAKLKESQRFYREVVLAAKLSTWEYDLRTHTVTLSDDPQTNATAARLGLSNIVRNVPDSILSMISKEDQPAFLAMYRKAERGLKASCEVWYKAMDGREPRCERFTYLPVNRPDGTPVRAIGFSQNITADRKMEERYQRELGYLREIDENNLGAKGHYNLTRNIVLEYTTKNDRFFKIPAGTSYDDAYQAFLQMLYKEEERREIADKLNRAKLMERYRQGQMQASLLYRRARKGELPFWISLNIHTYMSPETGDLESFTYAYDVTSKMQTDELIGLISEVEFDFIGLIYADTDTFELIKKKTGVDYADVRSRVCYSLACAHVSHKNVDAAERAAYEAAVDLDNILAGLRANGGRHTVIYRRNENGRVLCKQIHYVWLDSQANIILVVRSDVTASYERDQAQLARIEAARLEADRANEAKSTFLSSMSHDLRTPLSGVLGFTELALREQDPGKKQAYLEKIDSAGHLLLDLVNDTLELSRIESGKAALEPEAVPCAELIPTVVTALRPAAELKGIRLHADHLAGGPALVWCDRLKVQKIALNLISNAIKYTPAGGDVFVRMLSYPAADGSDDSWSLCVEDNGIGMSESFMQQMFEPFSQEKRSESVKTPGTGLGLSIVKRYVDLMGGRIDVKSELHKGTRWVISLPLHAAPSGGTPVPAAAGALPSLAGLHVLLCEDNPMNTEIAVMLLRDRGIRTDTAENGKQGVDRFAASAEGTYDAILMDLRMPVMDGLTATRRIRALLRPDASRIPIIAMTADAFEESIREARDAGMTDYVTKPIEPQKLYAALQNGRLQAPPPPHG